jgi:hypothetical protein
MRSLLLSAVIGLGTLALFLGLSPAQAQAGGRLVIAQPAYSPYYQSPYYMSRRAYYPSYYTPLYSPPVYYNSTYYSPTYYSSYYYMPSYYFAPGSNLINCYVPQTDMPYYP